MVEHIVRLAEHPDPLIRMAAADAHTHGLQVQSWTECPSTARRCSRNVCCGIRAGLNKGVETRIAYDETYALYSAVRRNRFSVGCLGIPYPAFAVLLRQH